MAQQLQTTEGVPAYNDRSIQSNSQIYNRNIQQILIRIAVLGATGVGKSSLCNLISASDIFEVNDGLESCTQQPISTEFYYTINNKQCHFKVTDFEGWFGANRELLGENRIQQFLNVVKRSTDITRYGISAILLLIPVGRLCNSYIDSIKFMKKYFGGNLSKHIILVFSKCNGKSVNTHLQQIIHNANVKQSAASKLVLDYLESIGNKCVATECAFGDTNICREELLLKIHQIHQMKGICNGNVMLQAFGRMEADIRMQREEARRQREEARIQRVKQKRYKITGFIMFVVILCMSYKYKQLNVENMRVVDDRNEIHKKLQGLITNYGPMISEIFSKIENGL
eukprot:274158_1